MGWKFWQKEEPETAAPGNKSQKAGRPRELPQEVGRYLVVEQNLDPDWIWDLKAVRKLRENSKSAYDIRIFDSKTAAQQNVKVRDYASLDSHMDIVLFAGWYDKATRNVQLEKLIKEAV